tara:strand:+ start:108 stop:503 length:396 start_codon:yes stop_codon:yes gene_type:complete
VTKVIILFAILNFTSIPLLAYSCESLSSEVPQKPSCHEQMESHSQSIQVDDTSKDHECPICQINLCQIDIVYESSLVSVSSRKLKSFGKAMFFAHQGVRYSKESMSPLKISIFKTPPSSLNWQAVYSIFII